MSCEIPDGLADMLREFTVEILREKPGDLYSFAAGYFTRLVDARGGSGAASHSLPMYVVVDGDDDVGEPDKTTLRPKASRRRFARRQSVAAERYDPEADDDDSEVLHHKSVEQCRRLRDSVKSILIFKSLDAEQMTSVINAMFEVKVEPEYRVIEQGHDGDNFYVIESGVFDVYVKTSGGEEKKVYTFEETGSFGELALLYNMPRSATVLATSAGTLWAMDRRSFRRIVLKSAFQKRRHYESLLHTVPLLDKLDSYERMNVADALTSQTFDDGDVIIQEGDEADGMYFVESGDVLVTVTKNGQEVIVPTSTTTYFGEMALLENTPRTATVYANGCVKVAYLERESFERLLGPCLDVMKRNIEGYVKSS